MARIRILMAEDNDWFRFAVRQRLPFEPDMDLIGEAMTGEDAVTMATTLHPDVILMDLKMPGIGGIEATRQIRQVLPGTPILILTVFDDDTALAAVRAGAHGYVLKDEDMMVTLNAIRTVYHGGHYYSPTIEDHIQEALGAKPEQQLPIKLTPREVEVLQLMAQGLTNTAIAERLSITEHAVRNRISDIYSAIGIEQSKGMRQATITWAKEQGLIKL